MIAAVVDVMRYGGSKVGATRALGMQRGVHHYSGRHRFWRCKYMRFSTLVWSAHKLSSNIVSCNVIHFLKIGVVFPKLRTLANALSQGESLDRDSLLREVRCA